VAIALGGLARHNVANALAAAAGARAMGATVAEVARGLSDFRPDPTQSPGRLNLFRLGDAVIIVDFAHNEAGLEALLDVADGIAREAGRAAETAGGSGGSGGPTPGRTAPITVIIGTAGDRPDDALVGIGRIAATRAQRVVVKETVRYLRGRTREDVVDRLLAGVEAGGGSRADVPVHETEVAALRAELDRPGVRVILVMCHAERDEVFHLLAEAGARAIDAAADLADLVGGPGLPGGGDRARA
jgi:cyanophycin synthetase